MNTNGLDNTARYRTMKNRIARTMTLYQLVDISHVERLASSNNSFRALHDAVQLELDRYCKENGIKESSDIQYITLSPGSLSRADPEVIIWIFLLLNPSNSFIRYLDNRQRSLIENAEKLNPEDYVFGTGYHYDHVAEKLGCSRMEGIYITKYWEIRPVYINSIQGKINLPYLFDKCKNAETVTELYSLYASCSIEEADKAVQHYLEKDAGELLSLFPDGILDISEKETVRMVTLSGENGEKIWQRMSHPFFKAHSPEPEQSALIFYNYIIHRIYRDALWRAIGFRDHHIKYGGYSDWGYESAEKLMFVKKEQYSYHDGGGGSRSSWCMLPLSRNKQKRLRIPKDMMTKEYYSKRHLSMPPCDGYWEEDGVLYVKNPFDMKEIFVLDCEDKSWN